MALVAQQVLEQLKFAGGEIKEHEVEDLSICPKKAVLASRTHHDVVVLGLQGRADNLGQFALVFDDQNPHYTEMLLADVRVVPDFCVRQKASSLRACLGGSCAGPAAPTDECCRVLSPRSVAWR